MLSLVGNGCIILEKKIFKSCQFIFTTLLEKKLWPFIWTNFNFFQNAFLQILVDIGPVTLEKKKNWKFMKMPTTLVSGKLKTHSKVDE